MEQQRDNREFNFEILKQISFFKFFGSNEWTLLEPNICVYKFTANDNILVEGDRCAEKQGIFIVSKGSVSVSKTSISGRDYNVRVLKQGEVFVNPGMFDNGPSPATLKAIEETCIFYLARNVILPIISSNNKVSESMYLIIAEIIRSAISVIDELAFKDNYSRLASFLLNVSKKEIINRNQFSLQFISNCINTVPEVVSRALKKLADDGFIEITRTKLIIIDREGLQNIALE
ncbi:MAG: Crp/Fnr family transcriptional regulator [Vulcanibacillus sp.]